MKLKKRLSMILTTISPKLNSYFLYTFLLHKILHLKNPERFSEKLMYLKLYEYNNNDLITKCCDKYAVREYIKEKGYEALLCKLYGVYESAEEIDFSVLPDSFALKCNHGCDYNIIVRDKNTLDIEKTKKQLNDWLKEDYWKVFSEFNYKNIERKIICEEYLENEKDSDLDDYKIYCFNGVASYVMLCAKDEDNVRRFYFFDRDWKIQKFTSDSINHPEVKVEKMPQIEKMFDIATELCKPFKFVRVDFYLVKNKIYFGELTFTPSACLDRNRLDSTDRMFGKMLNI